MYELQKRTADRGWLTLGGAPVVETAKTMARHFLPEGDVRIIRPGEDDPEGDPEVITSRIDGEWDGD